jgi:threonine dehydrogenase-like Zn-dependent dehydrogenase
MADIVIESSGAGRDIINSSLKLLRKRGTFSVATRKGAVPEFDLNQVVAKQIVLRGTRGHSYQAVELALQLMAQGRMPLERISSHVVGLADLDSALKMVGGESKEKSIHITVDPWKS